MKEMNNVRERLEHFIFSPDNLWFFGNCGALLQAVEPLTWGYPSRVFAHAILCQACFVPDFLITWAIILTKRKNVFFTIFNQWRGCCCAFVVMLIGLIVSFFYNPEDMWRWGINAAVTSLYMFLPWNIIIKDQLLAFRMKHHSYFPRG